MIEGGSVNGLALCAGVGGLELGLRLAIPGYRCVAACERDCSAAAILARSQEATGDRFPIWDDLKTFDCSNYRGAVDIVSAGIPCQPFSSAGKRRGLTDNRWVWDDVARIIREVGPRLIVLENVPRFVQTGLGPVLGTLADLGFDAEWGLFSCGQCGMPHRRQRFFLVAWRVSNASRLPLWKESGRRSGKGDRPGTPEPRYVGEELAD